MFRDKQQIVICVIAVVMIGGFFLFRYLPLRKKIKSVRQAYAAQMLAVSKASAQSRRIPAIKEQLLRLQKEVENYEQQVPAERTLGEFLHRIADLMNEHNLREQLVQPGKEIEAGQLNCIPVKMQCKGELSQIFEFYKRVQELDRIIRIEHVKLENDTDFSGEVNMQTNAFIYYRTAVEQG